jgi:methionyl-tRNA formyltransferase
MVVVGYGQIIPQAIIDLPRLGIVNVHASLLPKYRGAAPIQWAVANGETRTGVTTMLIDAGLDTGAMLERCETEIGARETAEQLSVRLAEMGADLLVETMQGLEQGTIEPEKQNDAEATHAPILKKEHGLIDWQRTASQIDARVRGFRPWPGCYTSYRGQTLLIWEALPVSMDTQAAHAAAASGTIPGQRVPAGRNILWVACGEGSLLELREVQLEGRKRMPVEAFLNGHRPDAEERFGEKL